MECLGGRACRVLVSRTNIRTREKDGVKGGLMLALWRGGVEKIHVYLGLFHFFGHFLLEGKRGSGV